METNGFTSRMGALAAALAIAVGGAGFLAGCGDDDNEGAAEEAGQAVDDASNTVTDAADDVDEEVGDDDGGEKGD